MWVIFFGENSVRAVFECNLCGAVSTGDVIWTGKSAIPDQSGSDRIAISDGNDKRCM
jgi:hypothetical protein